MADDDLYPLGYNFVSRHVLSQFEIAIGDTLVITRVVVNNEAFPITGLYFTENLPASIFEMSEYSIKINSENTSYLFYQKIDTPLISGYETYYWVVDSPFDFENLNNPINAGDSVYFALKIVPDISGVYLLPRHTTVFYGNGIGFFSTADSVYVNVTPGCGNANGIGDINLLDVTYLINHLYKQGPPPVADSDVNGDSNLNLLDITYLIFFIYRGGPEPACP
jgi:hypothetical protein